MIDVTRDGGILPSMMRTSKIFMRYYLLTHDDARAFELEIARDHLLASRQPIATDDAARRYFRRREVAVPIFSTSSHGQCRAHGVTRRSIGLLRHRFIIKLSTAQSTAE